MIQLDAALAEGQHETAQRLLGCFKPTTQTVKFKNPAYFSCYAEFRQTFPNSQISCVLTVC